MLLRVFKLYLQYKIKGKKTQLLIFRKGFANKQAQRCVEVDVPTVLKSLNIMLSNIYNNNIYNCSKVAGEICLQGKTKCHFDFHISPNI